MPVRRLRAYLAAVAVVGTAVIVHAAFEAARTPQPLGWLTLAALAMVAGSFRLNFASVSANISIDPRWLPPIPSPPRGIANPSDKLTWVSKRP